MIHPERTTVIVLVITTELDWSGRASCSHGTAWRCCEGEH
jgi:hypothetical protein